MFLLGDLTGSIERLDQFVNRPGRHRPISMLAHRATAALVRAFRGDRDEALEHLIACRVLERDLGLEHHYVPALADLARAVLASWDADDESVRRLLQAAIGSASTVGAANLLRVCELVADFAGHQFRPPDDTILQRAGHLPFVDSQLAIRSARRLVDLGDSPGAASKLLRAQPHELALSSWVHVLLDRHPLVEVQDWLNLQPRPSCAHAQVVRFLAEATVADDPKIASGLVKRAVTIASDRRLVAVIADAPAAMWERNGVSGLDLPLLNDARRRLREGVRLSEDLQFTAREIELLRLMARSATAPEIASRLYLSINTVKWHKANIYRKLGVSSGREAINRGRELHLIADDTLGV